ncbi:hypothetical protein PAMA_008557 [Pampus argenteus]
MASPEPLKYNGYGEIITVENCQKYCDQVMSEVEKQTGKQYTVYVAEQYRIEPAGGRNFLIKVHVGGDDHVHLRVYEKLLCNGGGLELSNMQQSKSHHDPIEYF